MKNLLLLIILILLCSTGYLLFDKFSTDDVNYSKEREEINSLRQDIEKIFIEKKNIELAFDSVEAVNKLLAENRKENNSAWSAEIKKAEKKCDPEIIHKLDSIYIKSDSLCNASLAAKDVQIGQLRSELKLDTIAFLKHDSIDGKQENIITGQGKEIKKLKRGRVFMIIGTTVAIITTAVIAVRQAIRKEE